MTALQKSQIRQRRAKRRGAGNYTGEICLSGPSLGRAALMHVGMKLSEDNIIGGGRQMRSFTMLESTGMRLVNKFNDSLVRRRLYLQMIATLLLAIGTLSVMVPAALMRSSSEYLSSWVVTSSVVICCLGLALFAMTELAILTLWRVNSTRVFRVVGFVAGGPASAHPSLIYASGLYGVLARRSLRRRRLGVSTKETFYSMIGEWEGSADELCRFARSLEK